MRTAFKRDFTAFGAGVFQNVANVNPVKRYQRAARDIGGASVGILKTGAIVFCDNAFFQAWAKYKFHIAPGFVNSTNARGFHQRQQVSRAKCGGGFIAFLEVDNLRP